MTRTIEAEKWQGLPYYPIGQFYRETFQTKVYKIPVSVADTCPNREGLRGMKTCNFCDVWGSAAFPEYQEMDLRQQIETARDRVRRRVNAEKFLVYFQAYTTTFAKVARLREQFEVAASYPEVKGVVVGTRPDCLSDALLDLWTEYSERFFISVELGVQSFNEDQLLWMRRGHSALRSVKAIQKISKTCPVDLGIHLMFGLASETLDEVKWTASICNALPIHNVKLHNLHVLENTPLASDYRAGLFEPIDFETYAERVRVFLQHLRPCIAVHRLSALASRSDELIAPRWTSKKMESYQAMLDHLRRHQAFQGQFYHKSKNPQTALDILYKQPYYNGDDQPAPRAQEI